MVVTDMTQREEQESKREAEATQKQADLRKEGVLDEAVSGKRESVEISRAEYEELLRKVAEFAGLQDKLLRSAADFDNARKRLAKERDEFLKFALEDVIRDFLPILDHFEMAVAHIDPQDERMKALREGFLLIQKQLSSVLMERGLKKIETLGKPFDPHMHEAVGHIASSEKPEGTILEEVLAGYQLNGKLIRAAKVKISTKGKMTSEEKSEELT